MGATEFETHQPETDIAAAFAAAREDAFHWYGHAGYTGSIAEKDDYDVVQTEPVLLGDAPNHAQHLLDVAQDEDRPHDKWGPAWAFPVTEGGWFFFGYASS